MTEQDLLEIETELAEYNSSYQFDPGIASACETLIAEVRRRHSIIEVRVLGSNNDGEWFVCVITNAGQQSTFNRSFASALYAETFASGVREGLAWQARDKLGSI
jgi:hypothetical protein